jgi:hypothetical protein
MTPTRAHRREALDAIEAQIWARFDITTDNSERITLIDELVAVIDARLDIES